jgi:SHS2 domain-containing protein
MKNKKIKFEVVEHTADIGIKVYGKNLQQLYENAAYGMFSLLLDLEKVRPDKKLKISVEGGDPESLLVNWLNELIYLQATYFQSLM